METHTQHMNMNNMNMNNMNMNMSNTNNILFEIPSNMILYKVGLGKWLTLQLFLFGLVSTF